MLRTTTALLALLALSNASSAEEYDDPAVAVCQYSHFEGKVPPSNFERIKAEIKGTAVTLMYQYSVLNTRPKQSEYSCQFERDEKGFFKLTQETYPGSDQCTKFMETIKPELATIIPKSPRALELMPEIQRCLNIFKQDKARADQWLEILPALLLSGIYPIDPTDTALSD